MTLGVKLLQLMHNLALPLIILTAPSLGAEDSTASKTPTDSGFLSFLLGRAEKSNLQLIEQRQLVEQAHLDVKAARGKLLPQLSSSGKIERLYQQSQEPGWNSTATVQVEQSLFNNGENWREYSAAQKSLKKIEVEQKEAREKLALDLANLYMDFLLNQKAFEGAQKKLKHLEKQRRVVERQYRQGLKIRRDFQLIDAEVDRVRLSLESFGALSEELQDKISALVGETLMLTQLANPKIQEELLKKTLPWAEVKIHPKNLSLERLLVEKEIAESQRSRARKTLYPEFKLYANGAYGSESFVESRWSQNDAFSANVGLSAEWTLWDWGGRRATIYESTRKAALLSKKIEQSRLEYGQEWKRLENELRRGKWSQDLSRKVLSIESQAYEEIQSDYSKGRSSYLDLITALERLIQADYNYYSEIKGLQTVLFKRENLQGTLYEKILAQGL